MSLNILILKPEVLKERTTIHTNVDNKLIYPEIKASQDMFILPLVGSTLFNKLLSDINNLTLSGVYKTLVDDYLIDALINYTMSQMVTTVNYQFWNTGVVSVQKDNAQMPSQSDMFAILDKYKNRAEHYNKRARMYLLQNQGLFPEYRVQNGGIDTVFPDQTSFTSPIYLGGKDWQVPNKSYNKPWNPHE